MTSRDCQSVRGRLGESRSGGPSVKLADRVMPARWRTDSERRGARARADAVTLSALRPELMMTPGSGASESLDDDSEVQVSP